MKVYQLLKDMPITIMAWTPEKPESWWFSRSSSISLCAYRLEVSGFDCWTARRMATDLHLVKELIS